MSKIKVALRVRPLSSREKEEGHVVVVGVEEKSAFITDIRVPERPSADSRQRLRQFDFDHVFWLSRNGLEGAGQSSIFSELGPDLEKSILTGHNATILCYGQSGTGKTHTMLGTKEDAGLIPRLSKSLWEKLKGQETRKSTFLFEVSFMEIYREKVRDLLVTRSEKVLKLREHPQLGPHVQGLTRIPINEEWEFLNLLWEGERRRAIGTTGSNRRSSRSHAIWTLYLTSSIKSDTAVRKATGLITRTNRVHLVDLAGSEKADLITTKSLLAEGKDINRSLVSLGNVISALAEKTHYIPYRDSTLTFLLKDSLGGNSSTSIIITASPASCCHAQTLNSFRFAQRARLVENQPTISIYHQAGDQSGFFGSMSANEIKKDISRLANLIRSAQNNGGIIRGLTPKQSWNRLIAAIEKWNHHHEKQNQLLRANSESLESASSCTKTCTSTSTMTSSLTDVRVQAEIKDDSKMTTSCGSDSSLPNSSCKLVGNEVFIPCSSTIKCLTWKQEEIQKVPKQLSQDSDSSDSFVSPPTSPIPEVKMNHLKYLLQVHYPTLHNLGSDSRIAEKIHGIVTSEIPQRIKVEPIEVASTLEDSPVIREKIPSLIGESQVENDFDELSSQDESFFNGYNSAGSSNASSNSNNCDVEVGHPKTSTPKQSRVKSGSNLNVSTEIPQFGFKIPKVSEFLKPTSLSVIPLESTDEFDQEDDEMLNDSSNSSLMENNKGEYGKFKTVLSNVPKLNTMNFRNNCETDILCYNDSSASSSSSYESLIMKPSSLWNKVKVVEDSVFDFNTIEDKLVDLQSATTPLILPFEQHVAKVCPIEAQEVKEINYKANQRNDGLHTKKGQNPTAASIEPTASTKFHMHFRKELNQMESIGKQIQNLKQLTNRHHIVKPYLDKIIDLQGIDHRISDPKLDAEIEECSGWNINIELALVQKDILKLNKLLKTGVTPGSNIRNVSNSTTNSTNESTSSSNNSDSCSIYKSITTKTSPASSTSSKTSRSGSKPVKHPFPSQRTQSFGLHSQQHTNPNQWKPTTITPKSAHSWNLQFPMSSHARQSQVSQELHHQNHNRPLNPFSNQMSNFSSSTGESYFHHFHSQAQQRLAQRWQPILPKTHDYLCKTNFGNENIDCCKGYASPHSSNSNFHPYPHCCAQLFHNTAFHSNPALLYPTNFSFQPPSTASFEQSHTPIVNSYQYQPPNTTFNDSQYESMHFNGSCNTSPQFPQNYSQVTF